MASTIPAFIAAYVAALQSPVGALSPAAIASDGQPMVDAHLDYIAVGYAENGPSVEAQQAAITLQNGRMEEYRLACQCGAANGDFDVVAVRARAFALFECAATVLTGDWDVSGTVTFAEIDTYTLTQLQTPEGVQAQIDFVVKVSITPV